MIKIITGKINSGKTTKMIELYEQNQSGDGFVSLKFMNQDKVDHYEIMKLSTKEKKVLMIHHDSPLFTEPKEVFIGPYHLQDEAIHWVHKEIQEMIKKAVTPLYLDELGLLELENKGFHQTVIEMISSKLDLIFVVRSYLLDEIIKKYQCDQREVIITS